MRRNDCETQQIAVQPIPKNGWRMMVWTRCPFFRSAYAKTRHRPGKRVTQLHYTRQGCVTPEMEFIAIREKIWVANAFVAVLRQQHPASGLALAAAGEYRRNLCVTEVAARRALSLQYKSPGIEPMIIGRNFLT